MFRSATSRLSSVVLAAGVLGLAAPLMGAGPELKIEARGIRFDPPSFGKLKVRFGTPQRRPDHRRPDHAAPFELELSAFQSGNTVIVVARGANRESGFVTRFSGFDMERGTPELRLINERNRDHGAQVITRFEVTGSFESRRQVSWIKVHVGNQCHEVRVVQTPCL